MRAGYRLGVAVGLLIWALPRLCDAQDDAGVPSAPETVTTPPPAAPPDTADTADAADTAPPVGTPSAATTTTATTAAPQKFTLTIAGGLSLGNYEAGVNWALLEARKRGGEHQLAAATGASAGAINALLSAIAWCAKDDASSVGSNLFRDVWVPVGFDTMLPWELDDYTASDLLMSRKVSHGEARKVIQRFIDTHEFREDCPEIQLAFAVTGQRSIYAKRGGLGAPSNYYVIPMTMRIEGKVPVFYPNYDFIRTSPNAIGLTVEGRRIERDRVVDAVVASSAFPFAFGPEELSYAYIGGAPCRDPNRCKMFFSDGGVFDNVPLGLALTLAPDATENIYFDPDVRRIPAKSCRPKKREVAQRADNPPGPIANTLDIYQDALRTARNRILFETLERLDPDRAPCLPRRFAPLTGDLVGAFGAWLDEGFRQYDYLAGVYDGLVYVSGDGGASVDIHDELAALGVGGYHAALLRDFQALENDWGQGDRVLAILNARPGGAADSEAVRIAMVRQAMFRYHTDASGKPRFVGGFCDRESSLADLVATLDAGGYAFPATSEFLQVARDRPDYWWVALASRALRRLAHLEEQHVIQAAGDRAHALSYPYDPRNSWDLKADAQLRLRHDVAEYRLLGTFALISETGTWQGGLGPNIALPTASDFDFRLGGHVDVTGSYNLALSGWLQLLGDYGTKSERARIGAVVGLQLVDIVRLGVGYHLWLNYPKDDAKWQTQWGNSRQELSLVLGLRVDTVAELLF